MTRFLHRSRLAVSIAGLLAITLACASAAAVSTGHARRELWGFTAFWDARSMRSLARNGGALDVAITTWIALDTAGGPPVVLHADLRRSGRTPSRRMALITSWLTDRFRPESVRRLASDPLRLATAAGAAAAAMSAGGQRGAVLDFEAHEASDLPALLSVVRAFADTLHARGLGPVTVAVPATDTVAYPARALIAAGADFVMPMLYDQHWTGGTPGPVAARAWVAASLKLRVRESGAARLVAALPLYGYQWPAKGAASTVGFEEAQAAATAAGTSLTRDSASGSLRASLATGGEIWVTDRDLLRRLLQTVERAGVRRVALWHLGQEDPGVWATLKKR